jgi:CHASE1-domain containing sensor protein
MKKMFLLAMVLLLGLSLVALAGCGGNTKQAQDLTKTADDAYAKIKTQLDSLQSQLTPVLGGAITGNVSGVTPTVLAGATTAMDAVLAQMPAVKADYQKVTALSGVPDYVSYADAMIKAIDASDAALTESKNFITSLIPLVQSGNTAGITQLLASNTAELNKLQELSNAASKAYDDAQAIKSDKNLK